MTRRRGVSIIEVLFAIAIVAVGMLGAIAVLTVAGRQMGNGLTADASARLASNAEQEFVVRAMDSPRRTWLTLEVPGVSYCIDPRGVAKNTTNPSAAYFPAYSPATGPRMLRINLRQRADGLLVPLGVSAADFLFCDRNDLIHELPADRTQAPVAVFENGEKRSFTGRLSWMATLHRPNKSPLIPDEIQLASDQALLCIVVFASRNAADLSTERLLNVTSIDGESVTIAPRYGQPQTDMDASEGEWLMLAGADGEGRQQFAWKRIQHAATMLPGDTDRSLSLAGRDWQLTAAQTQAVLIEGVVLVVERTIRVKG